MIRRPPRSTRTDTLFPYTTLCRSFGGILAFNTTLDAATTKAILDRQFVEVLIAPDYEPGALVYAAKKANVRVLKIPHVDGRNNVDVKHVGSGLLMLDGDHLEAERDELQVEGTHASLTDDTPPPHFARRAAQRGTATTPIHPQAQQ